jgi:succinate dehydrogenase/fumarate reductase cytochrome b subunit
MGLWASYLQWLAYGAHGALGLLLTMVDFGCSWDFGPPIYNGWLRVFMGVWASCLQ